MRVPRSLRLPLYPQTTISHTWSFRFYVDFSTKLVAAERLLWERALKPSDSSSGGDHGDGEGKQ